MKDQRISLKANFKSLLLCIFLILRTSLFAQGVGDSLFTVKYTFPEVVATGDILWMDNGIMSGPFTTTAGFQGIYEKETNKQLGSNASSILSGEEVLPLGNGAYFTNDGGILKYLPHSDSAWVALPIGNLTLDIVGIYSSNGNPGFGAEYNGSGQRYYELHDYNFTTGQFELVNTYPLGLLGHVGFIKSISDYGFFVAEVIQNSMIRLITTDPTTNAISEYSIMTDSLGFEILKCESVLADPDGFLTLRLKTLKQGGIQNEVYRWDTNPGGQMELLFEVSHGSEYNFQMALSDLIVGGDFVAYSNGTDHSIKFPGGGLVPLPQGLNLIDLTTSTFEHIPIEITGYATGIEVSDGVISLSTIPSNPVGLTNGLHLKIDNVWVATDCLVTMDFNPQPIPPTYYTYYIDSDMDNYSPGDTTIQDTSSVAPLGYLATMTAIDCNDNDNTIYPGATEILDNQIDENCDGVLGMTPVDTTGTAITNIPSEAFHVFSSNEEIIISTNNLGSYTYSIINLLGQLLVQGEFEQEVKVPLNQKGIFFIQILDQNNAQLVKEVLSN